jgi:hypothetical protein
MFVDNRQDRVRAHLNRSTMGRETDGFGISRRHAGGFSDIAAGPFQFLPDHAEERDTR